VTRRAQHETEIKLRVAGSAAARRLLRRKGFHVRARRVFEQDTVYDTCEQQLRGRGLLLRLRQAGRVSTLTFKGTPEAGKHKSREELEVRISDPAVCQAILSRLGFEPLFRYEKYRTEYVQPRGRGIVTLDETPIGVFLEIEGPANWIDCIASHLGFTEDDYITKSYGALYLDHCRRQGLQPGHMLF
jgi:adenylate cyclase class 2